MTREINKNKYVLENRQTNKRNSTYWFRQSSSCTFRRLGTGVVPSSFTGIDVTGSLLKAT